MIIYELCCCEDCGKTYKGKFKFNLNGKVACFDCDSPDVYLGLQINQVDYGDRNQLLYDQFSEFLISDLTHLYPLDKKRSEAIMEILNEQPIANNMDILYYYYNPYELVRVFREVAYVATYYILQTTKGEPNQTIEFAYKLLDAYFQLRERELSEEELTKYWALIASEEVRKMKQVIQYVSIT